MKVQIKHTLVYKGKVVPYSEILDVTEEEGIDLVERGLVFQLEEETVAPSSSELEAAKKEYNANTIPELKEIAKTAEVDLTGVEKKDAIIDALIKKEFG